MYSNTKKISILIPAYNEEASLPLLYPELVKIMSSFSQYEWEVLFVNDGSKDSTLEKIKKLRLQDSRICYLDLSRNFGKENAMLAGFDYVTGDCMVIMDADLQDPPALITDMIAYWEEGYDDVYAKRKDRGEESWLRKVFSITFYKILQKSSSRIDILENVGDFRLLDRKCIDALKSLRESNRYTKGLFCSIGFKKKELLFDRSDRVAGKSSFNFISLFNLAIEGITSFTTFPLRFISIMGILVSCSAFIYSLYFLFKTILYGDSVQGFPTLVIIILLLGGVNLLALGIIGEYLSRIFTETKNRPVYFIREYAGSNNIQ